MPKPPQTVPILYVQCLVYHRPYLLLFGGGGDRLLANGGKINIYFLGKRFRFVGGWQWKINILRSDEQRGWPPPPRLPLPP